MVSFLRLPQLRNVYISLPLPLMLCPYRHTSFFYHNVGEKNHIPSLCTLRQRLVTYCLLGLNIVLSRILPQSPPIHVRYQVWFGTVCCFLATNRKTQGSNIPQHPVQQCAVRDSILYTLNGYMQVVSASDKNGVRRYR